MTQREWIRYVEQNQDRVGEVQGGSVAAARINRLSNWVPGSDISSRPQ
jgi:hypothetical protein